MTVASDTAYHSFAGEVEARTPPRYAACFPSGRHQLLPIPRSASARASNAAKVRRDASRRLRAFDIVCASRNPSHLAQAFIRSYGLPRKRCTTTVLHGSAGGRSEPILDLRSVLLDQSENRRVVDRDAAFAPHLLDVAVAHPVATVPAHRPEHDLAFEVASLEVRHGSTLPARPHPAGPRQGLQQSRIYRPEFFG